MSIIRYVFRHMGCEHVNGERFPLLPRQEAGIRALLSTVFDGLGCALTSVEFVPVRKTGEPGSGQSRMEGTFTLVEMRIEARSYDADVLDRGDITGLLSAVMERVAASRREGSLGGQSAVEGSGDRTHE